VKVLVLYHSQQYGNTEAMAIAIANGAKDAGADVALFNTNDNRFDVEDFRQFDVVAFGSPDYFSYIAGGLKVFFDDLHIARKTNRSGLENKPYGLFCSYGRGGRVIESFEKIFKMIKLGAKIGNIVESQGTPSTLVLNECQKLGKQLAECL
jgi:multimeric flavodoxin WrbA